jgi:hypothetical protein
VADPRPKLDPAFKSIFLIISLDLVAGFWLGIHREKAVEFFLSQVPLIGAAGVLYSFFPKDTKEEFGVWLQRILGKSLVRWGLVVSLVLLCAATLFRVSASVTLNGNEAAWLYFAPDRGGAPPPNVIIDSSRLNRLTSPVDFARWRVPTPLTVWSYTPTMISKSALRMRFWRPASLMYPDDFDSLAVLAALPGAWLFGRLPVDTALVVLHGRGSPRDTVAIVSVHSMGSYLVSYTTPELLSVRDTLRWADLLAGTPDSAATSMVRRWAKTSWVRARRPIRQGETLSWILAIGNDSPRNGQLVVRNAISQVYLAN